MFSDITIQERLIETQEKALIKMIIQFLIWGSYIWFSERSRHTFAVVKKDIEITSENKFI